MPNVHYVETPSISDGIAQLTVEPSKLFWVAGPTSLQKLEHNPEFATNWQTTVSEVVLSMRGTRIVYASSGGSIYGEVRRGFAATETDELQPVSTYGQMHSAIETSIAGPNVVSARIANLVPSPTHCVSQRGLHAQAILAALTGSTLTVYGTGHELRDYVRVDDAAAALLAFAGTEFSGAVNTGSGVSLSTNSVVHQVELLTGRQISREYRDRRSFELSRNALNVTKLKSLNVAHVRQPDPEYLSKLVARLRSEI